MAWLALDALDLGAQQRAAAKRRPMSVSDSARPLTQGATVGAQRLALSRLGVQAETYLLLCQRDIERNPVRAGMVADPAEYPWSSYRANALGEPNPILTPHPLYLALGPEPGERLEAYRNRFRIALAEAPLADLRMALNQNQPLGNDRFYAEIESAPIRRRASARTPFPSRRGRPRAGPRWPVRAPR
jgi:putative transposase